MKSTSTVLSALALALFPLVTHAAQAPPLLPATTAFTDLAVAASSTREFDIEVPRSEKYLPFEVKSVQGTGSLSGVLRVSIAGSGQPLYERSVEGAHQMGGLIPLPASSTPRRLRVSFGGGDRDMRADLSLIPAQVQLKNGQVVPVFAVQRGSDAFSQRLNLRLSRDADVDIYTWGGDASATLRVFDDGGGGFPGARCEDSGDAWRRCTLPGLGAGTYEVILSGNGSPVNLIANWKDAGKP